MWKSLSCVHLFVTPVDCNMPDIPVLHYLSEFAQVHVQWVSDAIKPFHPLSSIFPSIRVFFNESALCIRWPKHWSFASASVLPISSQNWFPLGLTGLISLLSKGLSRVVSSTTIQNINSSALSLLYGPNLTPIYDYWKNHSSDYTDLCWQNDVSAF